MWPGDRYTGLLESSVFILFRRTANYAAVDVFDDVRTSLLEQIMDLASRARADRIEINITERIGALLGIA